MMQVKQFSDNEIYLSIKYIKSVLWRVAKRLSYIEDAWCLKVNTDFLLSFSFTGNLLHCRKSIKNPSIIFTFCVFVDTNSYKVTFRHTLSRFFDSYETLWYTMAYIWECP